MDFAESLEELHGAFGPRSLPYAESAKLCMKRALSDTVAGDLFYFTAASVPLQELRASIVFTGVALSQSLKQDSRELFR